MQELNNLFESGETVIALDLGPSTVSEEQPPNDTLPSLSKLDIAAQRPFTDVPDWIWRIFFASWIALIAAFILIFGVSSEVRFVLGVVCAFAAAFFGVPIILLRMTRRTRVKRQSAAVQTLTGVLKAQEAALQIVLLPLVLLAGLIAIAFAIPR